MKNSGIRLLICLVCIWTLSSCEKEQFIQDETFFENYQDNSKNNNSRNIKIKICKPNGNGTWKLIEIAKSAESAHLKNGALYPGLCFAENKGMNEHCEVKDFYEIADDNIDNDCDGLIDCEDPDIKCLPIVNEDYNKQRFTSYSAAEAFCINSTEAGLENWRMATLDETKELDKNQAFELIPSGNWFWTSTTDPNNATRILLHQRGTAKVKSSRLRGRGIYFYAPCVHD